MFNIAVLITRADTSPADQAAAAHPCLLHDTPKMVLQDAMLEALPELEEPVTM